MIVPRVPSISPAAERSEQLVALVYALLDALTDTNQLAGQASRPLQWSAHQLYLRDLQRTGREILARACNP
jgi:hypothetical protein